MKKVSSRREPVKPAGRGKTKKVYRVSNWAAYNQALVQRGNLTVWLDEAVLAGWHACGPPQRGAQFVYSDRAIETALTFRLLFNLPLRQTQGFMTSLMALLGVDLAVPTYSTLSRRQAHLSIALPLRPAQGPIHLVVDSTGLKVYGESEWKVRVHGWSTRRTWRKLHMGFNAETGEVVAQTLTEAKCDDASQAKPLMEQTPVDIGRFYGDGGYDRWKVHRLLAYPPAAQAAPIEAVIPPQKNATTRKAKRRYRHIEARNQRVEAIEGMGRKRWKKQVGYHRRSLAETGVARYKRIIGPKLRARALPQQQSEARLGCSILNRMIHLGKPETYTVEIAR